jgi:hypothetical protein
VHGVKTRYKFILEGKTYSYKVVWSKYFFYK